MERMMSVEDKIRRAEEIYYKRRNNEISAYNSTENAKNKKRNLKLVRKLVKQIITCLIIYMCFYVIINNNYVFSEDFSNKIKECLQQEVNFKGMYLIVKQKAEELYKQINKVTENSDGDIGGAEEPINENTNADNSNVPTDGNTSDNENEPTDGSTSNNENEPTDGSTAKNVSVPEQENSENQETKEVSQMEQDANHIKASINFIKPINGKISSGFGARNSTTASVPKNHTGTDIAAEKGTKILSATEGKVILASSTGDYGNHLIIQTNDITLVYAHCNKLYVKEGENVKQGQEIAEVGKTGNATGPHLHFEIRYQDRYVDPQLILEL